MQEYDPNKEKTPEQEIDEHARRAEQSIDELIRSMNETLARTEETARRTTERQQPSAPAHRTETPRRKVVREPSEAWYNAARKEEPKKAPPKKAAKPEMREDDDASGKSEISAGKKAFIYVAAVLLASLLLAFFAWRVMDDVCGLTAEDELVAVTVEPGEPVGEIAAHLREEGVIRYPIFFNLYCRIAHAQNRIVPGTYELNKTYDYHALVNSMSGSGKRATVTLMIPEGYTCEDIYSIMETNGVCSAEKLRETAASTDFDFRFLEDVPMDAPNRLEGCLFPDTYEFYLNDEPANVLKKLLQNTDRKLTDDLWEALDALNADLRTRRANAGFSSSEIAGGDLRMYDVLNVASLIEKETAGASENGTIASVIYNRLCSKAYPLLNIDATIQYALQERKEILTDADKLIESPYNTYKYPGLPVGPIANPGLLAIRGALYPQSTDYYFYALGKDGKHVFTRTYQEHLAFLEELEKNG